MTAILALATLALLCWDLHQPRPHPRLAAPRLIARSVPLHRMAIAQATWRGGR